MVEVMTKVLEDKIKELFASFSTLRHESADLYALYWKGSVNTEVGALALASTPAAKDAKLNKGEMQDGVTLAEKMMNFFNNDAVATADHLAMIEKITHGDAVLATAISNDTEAFGTRVVQFATDLLTQYQRCKVAQDIYTTGEIAGALSGMSAQTVLWGSSATKDDVTSAMTLINEFVDFIENAAVTTGDYKATLAKWLRI
jgi:hypothetical protein